jgi:hypothetical protein
MKKNEDNRVTKDRRESSNERSEEFIKYFIPQEEEKRGGKDRRKSNPDSD